MSMDRQDSFESDDDNDYDCGMLRPWDSFNCQNILVYLSDYYEGDDVDMAFEREEEKWSADAEQAEFECLETFQVRFLLNLPLLFSLLFQVEQILNESVAALVDVAYITPSLAKILLNAHRWDVEKVCLCSS